MGELTEKRIRELADRSYKNSIYTFTDFLSLSEQETFYALERELGYAGPLLFGGSDDAERRILRFGDPAALGYEEPFPITCLLAEPLIMKFSDSLTHRDYLGALMNLGIERDLLGDILVKDNRAVIFCIDRITEYICENLTRVKHTSIKISGADDMPESFRPELEERRITVGSERLDSVVSAVFHLSRTKSLDLFREKKIAVSGRITENNSAHCREGDIISVRGHGKFLAERIGGTSSRGRTVVVVQVYK